MLANPTSRWLVSHRGHRLRAGCVLVMMTIALPASAQHQPQPGEILVADPDADLLPGGSNRGVLFAVNPLSGSREVVTDFSAPPLTGGFDPRWIAIERDGNILVVDQTAGTNQLGALIRIRRTSGAAAMLSDFGNASHGLIGGLPLGVAVEADGRILVMDMGAAGTPPTPARLFRIDPDTGVRTVLSDFSVGANTGSGSSIAVEADGQILVLDQSGIVKLMRVNPANGTRTIVSSLNEGANPAPTPRGIAVEPTGAVLVVDLAVGTNGDGALIRVNPLTGARTRVSDFGDATQGPLARDSMQVAVGAAGQIYVSNQIVGTTGSGAVFEVDPVSGQRILLSDFGDAVQGATGLNPFGIVVVPPPPGTIVVIKSVVNNNGGNKVPSDWTINVTGGHPDPATFAGTSVPGTMLLIDPGPYSISETGPTGYASTLSAECSGSIASGETKTCTMTSDDLPGTLVVAKAVVNDNGGAQVASDWTFTVTGVNPSPSTFAGALLPGTTITLDPGAYSVSETGPGGYTTALSLDCAGTIAAGQTRTCVSTSDDIPRVTLTVSRTGSGTGSVTSTPAGIGCPTDCQESYLLGTGVTLSALADPGSTFSGWSGDLDCADGIVTMTTNLSCTAAFAASARADLVVSALNVPAGRNVAGGALISVNSTTTNASAMVPAAPSRTAFYLSADATPDAADVLLGSRTVPGLAPGAKASSMTEVMVPAGVAVGDWFIVAVADVDSIVVETNETNNSLSKAIRIKR